MTATLTHHSYGKSLVRLTKVIRNDDGTHDVLEMSVDVTLEGDFADSYTAGDNRKVVATDSMKNTVYVLARETEFDAIDPFARVLARHFVATYPQVQTATIDIRETMFNRIPVAGKPHGHAWAGSRHDQRTCRVQHGQNGETACSGGLTNLVVLKSGGSSFVDFVTDRFRTLPDTTERIFATTVDAVWHFSRVPADPTATYHAIRPALLSCFAQHESLAVQQTLLEMGRHALDAASDVDRITLSLPNQHRIPVNLEPFGLDNPATVFVPTDEPAGQIRGTVERS